MSQLLLFALLAGCSLDRSGLRVDGGPSDAGGLDAGALDAGRLDGGRLDAGPDAALDAGLDGGGSDAGTPDAGCADAGAAPALTVRARAAGPVTIDGDLGEWSSEEWVSLAPPGDFVGDGGGSDPTDGSDLSARLAARWEAGALYLAVEVTDQTQRNDYAGSEIWRGDSVQVAFDVAENGGSSYDTTDDFEYGYALTSGGNAKHRWVAPSGAPAATDTAVVVRVGTTTRYEVRLAAADLGLGSLSEGRTMGFAWVVNEDDTRGDRDGTLRWADGIAGGKRPRDFGTLLLAGACL